MDTECADCVLKNENQGDAYSFGLKSIDNRLKLVFGENYGLSIRSEMEQYTEVLVKIPASMGGSQHDKIIDRRR